MPALEDAGAGGGGGGVGGDAEAVELDEGAEDALEEVEQLSPVPWRVQQRLQPAGRRMVNRGGVGARVGRETHLGQSGWFSRPPSVAFNPPPSPPSIGEPSFDRGQSTSSPGVARSPSSPEAKMPSNSGSMMSRRARTVSGG